MDRELAELLEESADRSVRAVDLLREDLAALRRALDIDRERDDSRFRRLEKTIDKLAATIDEVDQRCAALVLEEDGPDGERIVTAKPATIGVDWKTTAGLITAFVAACIVPIVVAVVMSN